MTDTKAKRLDFLSGEAIDGELLAVKLNREMCSPDEALRFALDVGTALARVHAQGLIHGKLSPSTVAIQNGRAVLLRPVSGEESAAYRSPEQLRGAVADERSDIFAYGALMYEMAAGERPFPGFGAAANSAILSQEVPPLKSRLAIYEAMDRVIAGCMAKDPSRRRQRVQNAVSELKLNARTLARVETLLERRALPAPAIAVSGGAVESPAPRISHFRDVPSAPAKRPQIKVYSARANYAAPRKWLGLRVWIVLTAALLLCAVSVAAMILLPGRNSAPVYRFSVDQENAKYPGMPAVSPDGRSLSWSAMGPEGKRMLWLQALDGAHAKPVANTEGATGPFWSPDSSYLAYFANGFLSKVKVQDGAAVGAPVNICKTDSFTGGGSWNKNGTIIFAPSLTGGLEKVPASGGTPQTLTRIKTERTERSHLWPQFLPDGKHFVFFVSTEGSETSGVYAGAIDSPAYSQLFSSETNAVYSTAGSAGYLLFIRNGSLMGQPFNPSKLATTGDQITLASNIEAVGSLSLAQISASDNGILVYQSAGRSTRQLTWYDRAGKPEGSLGDPGDWGPPRLSPDGKHVAAGRRDDKSGVPILWVISVADGSSYQLTHLKHGSAQPIWSPDSSRIAFSNEDSGVFDLYVQSANPDGKAELLYHSPNRKVLDDWTRDGRFLIFDEYVPGMNRGLFGWRNTERRSSTILDTIHSEGFGAVSPDGKWLAYQSDESGSNEVVVQAFDGGSGGVKKVYTVSGSEGGGLPHWRRDGKELFYITQPGNIFGVATHPTEATFAFDSPKELVHTRPTPKSWNLYDVSPDGERFLVNTPMDWPSGSKIVVITSWLKELQ